jgi:uncharacterized protein (TIGR03437 family)
MPGEQMIFRSLTSVTIAMLLASSAGAQSTLKTLLGGIPDGLQALSSTLNTPSAAVSDGAGDIYVALKGAHVVIKLDKSGMAWLVAGSGSSGSAGDGGPAKSATLNTPTGLALDSGGNLYIADSAAHRIRRVGTDGVITTVAGNGKSGYAGDGGAAASATLNSPSAVAVDAAGNLLIADTGNHEIRKVTADGQISAFAGVGIKGYVGNGSAATSARLNYPAGVAADKAGNVYIADTGNNWVRLVTPDGTISLYAGVDTTSSSGPFGIGGGDPTLAVNVSLGSPTSLAVDQSGNLYVVESATYRIRRISAGDHISYFAGTGTSGFSGDEGLARFAELNVLGVAVDSSNNVVIADGISNRVRTVNVSSGIIDTIAGVGLATYDVRGLVANGNAVFFSDDTCHCVRKLDTSTGVVSAVAGNGQAGFSGDTYRASTASLNTPRGLALDKAGNLYIADSQNHRVRCVYASDATIDTVAGNGTADTQGDGYWATSAELNEPVAVAVDTSGNLYIAERSGHVVREVGSDGKINTVAGTGTAGAPSAETGVAVQQPLRYPQGLAMDSQGRLLIADTQNNRIRRLNSDGTITTVAGTSTSGSTGDGGAATSAKLTGPQGMAMDTAGDLYISDTGNNKIRRVGTDGNITTVAGMSSKGFTGDGSPATAYALNGPVPIITGSGCNVVIGDTGNQRMRQLTPAVDYTITSVPAGLSVVVDGSTVVTPVLLSFQAGTHHTVQTPNQQNGTTGTRYLGGSVQAFDVPCGPSPAAIMMTFAVQYSLAVGSDSGGTVTSAAAWQDAGTAVTLDATPKSGYGFTGWEGNCSGIAACRLVMDGPKSVKADFAPTQALKSAISSGGVVGAGLSTPPVQALSPNGSAIVFGTGFAPAGTSIAFDSSRLVNGKISTEMDGVCVLVGGVAAPLLGLTPTQVNFQVPKLPDSAAVQVTVVTGCGTVNAIQSAAESVAVQSAAPEFFYFSQTGTGQNPIAAVDATTGVYIGKPGSLSGATFAPARPGDVVTLYATGLGVTSPAFDAGVVPGAQAAITGKLAVTIGTVTLADSYIKYAGVAPGSAGLYQLNIQLPGAIPDGDQPVAISVNGIDSPASGYLTIKQ